MGPLLLVGTEEALTGLFLDGHRALATLDAGRAPGDGVLAEAGAQLAEYFSGRRRSFDLPLVREGTPFQEAVWAAMETIPFGETVSYGELARRAGRPRAMRAVGGACGRNPIPIFVPCHRVVGSDGSLTGFGGGLPRKVFLLELESRVVGGGRHLPAMGRVPEPGHRQGRGPPAP
jgi:methylated-DNA-[protein]-cysteine S-methyltransferase